MKNEPVLERTLILLKPDAIERRLTGEILSRFERKGLSIVTANLVTPDKKLAQSHYQEHKNNEPYYGQMWGHICSGPNLAVVLEGELAIKASRQIIGNQDPVHGSQIGTIRGDYGIKAPANLVHGSDSYSSAKREIILWFGKEYVLEAQKMTMEIAPGLIFEYSADMPHSHVMMAKKKFMIDNGLIPNPKQKKPKFKEYAPLSAAPQAPGVESPWGPPVMVHHKVSDADESTFEKIAAATGATGINIIADEAVPSGTTILLNPDQAQNAGKTLWDMMDVAATDDLFGPVYKEASEKVPF